MKGAARNLRMFSVRQPLPLLMAASRVLGEHDFSSFLRAIVVMSFRYNVIGNFQTSEQERTYHAEAARIATGEHTGPRDMLEGVRQVYPSDDQFRASFHEKSIAATTARNRGVIRYILCELERQRSGMHLDVDDGAITLEHVCPLGPQDGWTQSTDEEIDALTQRLGNVVLLERDRNRDIGNAEYEAKRAAYRCSVYETTRELGEQYGEWTPEGLGARQAAMAVAAATVWRVGQLD